MTNTAHQPRRSGYERSSRRPLVARGLRAGAVTGCLGLLVATAEPARALTIVATFDSSITSNANAAAIESEITSALGFYSAFSNTTTVSIDFQLAPTGATYLGGSISSYYYASYAGYTTALLDNATTYGNSVEMTGYDHLATGNKATQILATSADLRTLGANTTGTLSASGSSGFDGIIYLNATDLTGFGSGGTYDATRVIQHETDEVLGIGGSGSVLNTVAQNSLTSPPSNNVGTYIGPLDLYRYSATGTASLTTSGSASSYFSIDGGATSIVAFNQNSGGDYGDWGASGCTALVQQAFSCSNQTASLTQSSPEVTALQAIGYDLPVPEPAALSLFGVGLIALGVSRFRHSPN